MKSRICKCCEVRKAKADRTVCTSCSRRKSLYGLSYDEMKEILKTVSCEICGIELDWGTSRKGTGACFDHCHNSNKFRGVLCQCCNVIEGYIRSHDHLEKIYKNFRNYINKAVDD